MPILCAGDVAGFVVGRDGRRLSGVVVGTSLLVSTQDGIHMVNGPIVVTDADGRFALEQIPLQRLRLVLSGDGVVGKLVPIEEALADPEHQLEVLRRHHVQIEGAPGLEVRLQDGEGKRVRFECHSVSKVFSTTRWKMRAPRSPVLTVPETVATMTWSKDGVELGRKTVALQPGKDRVTTLVAGR